MITPWQPREIIINEKVIDDPITQDIISQCPGIPVKYVVNSKSETVSAASAVLRNAPHELLPLIKAGKSVVYIAPAGTGLLDPFKMADTRMMCPEFDRVKFASNGCFYNCDWCFLKATYRANQNYITIHVQYDRIKADIEKHLKKAGTPVLFDSGELADSLSMEHLTKCGQEFIPWFGNQEHGYLYMLTKSTNVDSLLELDHKQHTIIAWSLNNDLVSREFELDAPGFIDRLNAAKKVQAAGYPIRIRLDPIVPISDWKIHYAETIKQIFEEVNPEWITIGTLRLEAALYNMRDRILTSQRLKEIVATMKPMLAKEKLASGKYSVGKYSFSETQRIDMFQFAIDEIRKYAPHVAIALCKETESVWNELKLDLKHCKCVCQYDFADLTDRVGAEM